MKHLKLLILKGLAKIGTWTGFLFDRPCELPPKCRILIFQAGGIGDVIRIFPLIESLHAARPQSSIAVFCPFADSVFDLFPTPSLIAHKIAYHPRTKHRKFSQKWRVIKTLRAFGFDLIINCNRGDGMLQNTLITKLINAPCLVGFDWSGAGFLHSKKLPFCRQTPILTQNLNLLNTISIPPTVKRITLNVPEKALCFAANFLTEYAPKQQFIITMQPGSQWQKNLQWPVDRYRQSALSLLNTYPCRIILLGTIDEKPLTRQIAEADNRIIDLAGTTDLCQAAALIKKSHLYVGNDSGLLHIALGFKTPTIGIFGYTSPDQVIMPDGPCIALSKPCEDHGYSHQPFFTFKEDSTNPIMHIAVNDVLEAADHLLTDQLPGY